MWRSSTPRPARRTGAALAVLATLLLLGGPAEANPWGHELGRGFLKVGTSYFTAEESFQQGMPTGLSYESLMMNLYAEVGLPWGFTAVMNLPYVIARNRGDAGVDFLNHTLGDARFGLQYRVLQSWPLSVGIDTKVPLYDLAREQGTAGLVDVDGTLWSAANFPDVGDGNVDLTFKVMSGTSFSLLVPGWVTAMAGYRKRFDVFVDSFVASMSAGAMLWQPYIGVGVFADGAVALSDDANPLLAATREHLYFQGELMLGGLPAVPGLGLSVAVGRVVVAEHSSKGTSVALGLSYKR